MDEACLNGKSDVELLALLTKDSEPAFEVLYIRYKEKLLTFCRFLLKSPTLSQDVVQEVFLKIWINRKDLHIRHSFSHYIYTIAKNRCLNELRSANRVELFEDIRLFKEEAGETDSGDTQLILKEYRILLQAAIAQLPDQKRKIYLMSRAEGLSHKEIAERLKLSPHTVQSHISDSIHSISDYFLSNADINIYSILMILLSSGIS